MVTKKNIIWTIPAKNDLLNIYNYLSTISLVIAEKQLYRIIHKVDILETGYTNIGQKEPLLKDRKRDYRYLVQDNYKIIYFVEDEKVVITTIFDTRQYPEKLKKKIK